MARPKDVIDFVEKYYHLNPREITGRSRHQPLAKYRQLAMYLSREIGYSYPEIGRAFGRTHADVIHAYRRTKKRLEEDAKLLNEASRISDLLRAF